MPVLSDSIFQARLPSGNVAVYSLQPHHVNDRPGSTLNQRCIEQGKQLAHQHGDHWYRPGGWEQITDLRTIVLLERAAPAY